MNVSVCMLMNTILAFIACNIQISIKQATYQIHCWNNKQTNDRTHYYFKFKSLSDQELK
jgi:hypothetical protein